MQASVLTIGDVARQLESWAPPQHAESYDNVGLLVGNHHAPITGILVNLDMTEHVVEEAITKGCNLIVAHHPIWFGSRKKLVEEDYVSRTLIKAIRNNINLYAIHTNLDNVQHGVNLRMAETLGLINPQILSPRKQDMPDIGAGMIGELTEVMQPADFMAYVAKQFHCGGIRYAGPDENHPIKRVAICGGAGSFLISDAMAAGADAFVTGDITYHKFFDQEGRMLLMDIGHYESEQFTSQLIRSYLSEKFSTFAVHLSETYTNPVRYYPFSG